MRVIRVAAAGDLHSILIAVAVGVGPARVAAGVIGINEDSRAGLMNIEHAVAVGVGLRVDGGLGDGVGEGDRSDSAIWRLTFDVRELGDLCGREASVVDADVIYQATKVVQSATRPSANK